MRINQPRSRPSGTRPARPKPMSEINIIPLVDVILVLLIIFMATTAFVKETGLKMQLPAAKTTGATGSGALDLTIILTRDNRLYINNKQSDEKTLVARLRAQAKRNPQSGVVIKGDQGIAYARVVRVLDLAREAGISGVALGTRVPQGAGAATRRSLRP